MLYTLQFFYYDLKSQAGIMGRGLKGDDYCYDIKAFLPFYVCHSHHFYFYFYLVLPAPMVTLEQGLF